MNHAVCVLPVFFTAEQVARINSPARLAWASYYEVGHFYPGAEWTLFNPTADKDLDAHLKGFRFWLKAVWDHAGDEARGELVRVFFERPLGLVQSAEQPYSNHIRDELPIHEWFRLHRDRLMEDLHSANRTVAQRTLIACFVRPNDADQPFEYGSALLDQPLVDPEDPFIIDLMIDGLASDDIRENQELFSGILLRHWTAAFPKIRQRFEQPVDAQQEGILCDLCIARNDDASRQLALAYLFYVIREQHLISLANGYLVFFPEFNSRIYLALARLLAIGAPAREFLLAKLPTIDDPQQLAISILALEPLGGLHELHWTRAMVDLLCQGLMDNPYRHDLGYCAAALKLGQGEIDSWLRDNLARSDDTQEYDALRAILAFYRGDWATYDQIKRSHFEPDKFYWEYHSEDLTKDQLLYSYRSALEEHLRVLRTRSR